MRKAIEWSMMALAFVIMSPIVVPCLAGFGLHALICKVLQPRAAEAVRTVLVLVMLAGSLPAMLVSVALSFIGLAVAMALLIADDKRVTEAKKEEEKEPEKESQNPKKVDSDAR
jgi:hypothetical protein